MQAIFIVNLFISYQKPKYLKSKIFYRKKGELVNSGRKSNEQTALNNSASEALSEFCSSKNSKHFEEIFRNSSLFNTSFVFVEMTSAHFSFNLMSASQSIVYCSTVKTFSALRLSCKNVSQWLISGRTKYFLAKNKNIIFGFAHFWNFWVR